MIFKKDPATTALDELTELAIKYGTDKWSSKHNYTPAYYDLFKNKQRSFKKILEIGIGEKAASLHMWQDFFPRAKIYGADYMPERMTNEGRIKSILVDQRKDNHLKDLINVTGGDIDVVIDDASHRPRDQVFTCLTLMPLLKKDVVYIIEDVADIAITERLSEYDIEIPELDPSLKRFDNKLVIVRHKKLSPKDKKVNFSFFAKKPTPTSA